MKKILFSAALVSATTVLSFPVLAQQTEKNAKASDQQIELQLGGYMTWYGTYGNQHRSTRTVTGRTVGEYNNFDLMGNAEIYFSGKTELENGVKIGAMVQLKAGTDSSTSDHVIDETYMTIDSKIGRFIAGNVKNVSNQMSVKAPSVSSVGEQETDFTRVIIVPAGFAYNKATYALLDDVSTKLSYVTPTFLQSGNSQDDAESDNGFTFGFSLMPGNKVKGKDADDLLIPNDGIKLFKYGADAAALYENEFGNYNVSVSATYTVYKPNLHANDGAPNVVLGAADMKEKMIKEFGGGINVSFPSGMGKWTVGGSYHYTNMSKETSAFMNPFAYVARGAAWDFGVKFAQNAYEASATILQSRADSIAVNGKKDIYTQYQISGKYKIAKGIDAFMDVAYLNFDSASDNKALSNKGPAVAMGMNLEF